MRRYIKRTLWISGSIVGLVLLVLIVAALLFFLDKPLITDLTQRYIGKELGLLVEIGKLDYTISPLRIIVSSLRVSQENKFLKLNVVLKRVEAKGEFSRLLHLRKPVFETVEAEGVEFWFERNAIPHKETDYQAIVNQAADILGYAQKLSVKEGLLVAFFPGAKISLEKVNLSLARSPGEKTFVYSLDAENASVRASDKSYSLETRINSVGTLALVPKPVLNGRHELDSLRIEVPEFKESFKTVIVEGVGEIEPGEKKLSLSRLTAGFPELAEISGDIRIGFGKKFSLQMNIEASLDNLGRVVAFLKPRLPTVLQDVRIDGKTRAVAKYSVSSSSEGKHERVEASLALDHVSFQYAGLGLPLQADVSGQLKVEGFPPDLRFAGDIQSNIGNIDTENVRIQDSNLRFKASGNKAFVDISRFEGTLKGLSFTLAGRESVLFEEAKLKGTARLDLNRKTLGLDSIEADLPPLPPVQSSAKLVLGPRVLKQIHLATKGLKLSTLRKLLASFIPKGLEAWDFDGALGLSVQLQSSAAQRESWDFTGDFALAGGKFNDPLMSIASEGLEPRIHLEGQYSASKRLLSISGEMELSQGESLWKNLYISWIKYPVTSSIVAKYNLHTRNLDGIACRVEFPTLGEVQAEGWVHFESPLSFNLHAHSLFSLAPVYSLYSESSAPKQSRLSIKGTLLSDAVFFKEQDGLSIKGRLTWRDGAIEFLRSKVAVRGLEADVPIQLETGGTEVFSKENALPDNGFIKVREMQTPLFTLQPMEVFFRSGKNAFEVDPFSLDIFGGKADFGKTLLSVDPATLSFKGIGSLRIRDMDVSRIPLNSPELKLSGKAAANFSRVEISPPKITTQGRAEVEIFGGKVIISSFSVARPFSETRAISLNADLVGLDLKKITDSVPFGEVTGIVRGEINDLTFSYGQPERFSMKFESVKKKGVPQRFSLKAVDNLTVISSGQKASLGTDKFWMRYVRGFSYEKIGIASTLRNDEFTIKGTVKDNGIEYLVKKPSFFGINVINREPEKKISFKEMMNRLKRVGRPEK